MAKRDIGKEIIQGLEEIKTWKKGKSKLKTFAVKLPRAADNATRLLEQQLRVSQREYLYRASFFVTSIMYWYKYIS